MSVLSWNACGLVLFTCSLRRVDDISTADTIPLPVPEVALEVLLHDGGHVVAPDERIAPVHDMDMVLLFLFEGLQPGEEPGEARVVFAGMEIVFLTACAGRSFLCSYR
jgi:hypothetical protein